MRRLPVLSALMVASGLLVSACGGSSSASSGASSPSTSASSSPSPSTSTSTSTTASSGGSNGIAALTPTAALQKTLGAVNTVQSVHIAGRFTKGSERFVMDVDAGTSAGQGRITVQKGHVDIRVVANAVYFRGDRAGLRAFGTPAAAVNKAAGKWIKLPASSASTVSALVLAHSFLTKLLSQHGTLQRGPSATINGQPAYGIVDTGQDGGTLYIAETGPPLPLKLVGSKHQALTFSNYNEPVNVTAPTGALNG